MSEQAECDHGLAHARITGSAPEILFLPGFRSDMTGSKAMFLDAHCGRKGRAFTRFDYRGHGASSGRFEDGTIGAWLEDTLCVLDEVVKGPAILVGSSMGGWLALLAALARPQRVVGVVGIAAAPDFTADLIEAVLTQQQRRLLEEEGVIMAPSEYGEPVPLTRRLIEEGREHLLLRGPIELTCPVHLLHGQQDAEVPWQTALRLASRLQSSAITVELIKDGDHRLSREADLVRLAAAVERVVAIVEGRL